MSNLAKLVSELQFAYNQPSPDLQSVNKLFTKFQIELIKSYNSLKSQQEFVNAMHGLEFGAQLFIDLRDGKKFERVIQQLSQFYNLGKIRQQSQNRHFLIGLYLMYLLTQNKLDDFHTELELLDDSDLKNEFISFSMNIETYLMDGSYNKILEIAKKNQTQSAKNDPRYDKFSLFLNDLTNTVRNEIADSLEAVHETMPIKDVLTMLKLSNIKTLQTWINQQNAQASENEEKGYDGDDIDLVNGGIAHGEPARRNWSLNNDKGVVVFVKQEQEQQSIDAMDTTKDMLEFTGHIETIV